MPVVPTYERTEGIDAGPTGPMASPDAFGAAIGRGLQQAGAGMQALGSDLADRQQKLEAFDAQTKAQAFNTANDTRLLDAGRTVQPGGVGLTDGVMKGFDKDASAFLKNVPASQRPRMTAWLEAERGRVLGNAQKAEIGLQEEYQRGHVTRYQNQVLTDVYRDPSQADAATARFEVYVDSTTLSPAEREQIKEAGRQQIRGFALRRTVGDEAAVAADAAMGQQPAAGAAAPAAPASPAGGAAAARGDAAKPTGARSQIEWGGSDQRISAPARQMLEGIAATGVVPTVKVRSGYRDPHRNVRAGGAKGSQHLHGNAVDIDVSGMSDEQKAAFLRAAVANGARGIGIYPSGNSIHIDTRGTPAVWGSVKGNAYKGHSVEDAPEWARPVLRQLFSGQAVAAPAAAQKQWSAADDPRFAGAPIADIMAADAAYAKAYDARVKQYDDAKKALSDEVRSTLEVGMEIGVIPDVSDIMDSGLGNKDMAALLSKRREAISRANMALTAEQGRVADEVAYADALGQPITREAITGLVDRGALSKADGAKWLNELTKREAEQGTVQSVEQRVKEGAMFDPLDTEDRKGVDAYYSQGDALAKLGAGDVAEATRLARTVDATGIIPRSASGVISGLLRSDDPAKLSTAVGIIDQMMATNSVAAGRALGQGGLNDADRATYEAVRSLSPYLTPEQLVEKVRQLRDPGDRARREAVEKTAKEELKAVPDTAVLDAFDESMWSDPEVVPEVMPGLREDFDALYTHFRRAFDDPAGAKDAATRVLKTMWGVSTIAGGQKLMKRPPEQVLPPIDGTHVWVERQLRAAIAGLGLEGPPPAPAEGSDATLDARLRAMGQGDVSLDDVHLVTTRDTLADIAAARSPRYRLVVKGPNGEWLSPGSIVFDPKAAADASLGALEQRREEFNADRERLPADMDRARTITEGLGGMSGGLQ
jgi:hypothetical protein